MLDIIADTFETAGISFCRLDGSTRNREQVVERFQHDERIPVFLISLKAGGVGLNLTAADTVIHFDPWWNPAVEAQATDRAHRIGQRRVVTSIKLIARDTVEERVLRMQDKKRELFEGTVDTEAALERLTTEDLSELVGTSRPPP
jgi:SNF2 family DNA or RNA helicase